MPAIRQTERPESQRKGEAQDRAGKKLMRTLEGDILGARSIDSIRLSDAKGMGVTHERQGLCLSDHKQL